MLMIWQCWDPGDMHNGFDRSLSQCGKLHFVEVWVHHWENSRREVRLLGRIITLTTNGYVWEADPKHAETVIKRVSVENCNGVSNRALTASAYELEEYEDEDGKPEELTEEQIDERAASRSNAMVASYLSLDRPELFVPVKEMTRGVSNLQ